MEDVFVVSFLKSCFVLKYKRYLKRVYINTHCAIIAKNILIMENDYDTTY